MKQTLSQQARTSIEGGVTHHQLAGDGQSQANPTSWSPYTEFGQAGRHRIQGSQDPVLLPPR